MVGEVGSTVTGWEAAEAEGGLVEEWFAAVQKEVEGGQDAGTRRSWM